jgi:putative DNA methylase
LYAVVAVRYQPKLDKKGHPQYFSSGTRQGEIKTEKVRFFRVPNETDLAAIEAASNELKAKWDHFDEQGLIPTEKFPNGNDMRPAIYGMEQWYKLFNDRQLLGHLYTMETLNQLKPQILSKIGDERGRAVVTYLQFAIDKTLDYNSRQTRWEFTRGVVKGTFGRHDFSLKWTYGEMVFSGPHSGLKWGLSQIFDGYQGIQQLIEPIYSGDTSSAPILF